MKDTKYKVKIWKFASDDGDDMTEHIVFRNARGIDIIDDPKRLLIYGKYGVEEIQMSSIDKMKIERMRTKY